jgi:uncharacterized cupredoxin-like copper-binding protein
MRRSALVLASFLLAALLLSGCSAPGGGEERRGISFRYSRFGPETISVPAGVPVSFTLRNDDPIAHEWIIGSDEVHARHRTGTEPYHDSLASEVTVPPFTSRVTTLTFAEPGEYAFICHLPGHEAYGMRGVLRVTPADAKPRPQLGR